MNKITRFNKSIATDNDVLIHEIGHIVLSEYSKIKTSQLHYFPRTTNSKITTNDPILHIIQDIDVTDKKMMSKYRTPIQNRLMTLLAGEVINAAHNYNYQIDATDIRNISYTPDGDKAYKMIRSAGFNYEKIIHKTLKILKKRKKRTLYLFDHFAPIVVYKAIVDIPQPSTQSFLHFLRRVK